MRRENVELFVLLLSGAKEKSNGEAKRSRTSARTIKSTPSRSKSATKKDDRSVKWTTLEHGGVLFPPEYTPHGVKLKYDGVPVDLTPEQEEVATMFAAMLETDYVTQKKEQFMKNFWTDFQHVLGRKHVIQSLDKCDFRDIYNHLMADREAKKAMSKEVYFPSPFSSLARVSMPNDLAATRCHCCILQCRPATYIFRSCRYTHTERLCRRSRR
jgi:Eukaryotic DNA topoisomerase I, DNA binding fragment